MGAKVANDCGPGKRSTFTRYVYKAEKYHKKSLQYFSCEYARTTENSSSPWSRYVDREKINQPGKKLLFVCQFQPSFFFSTYQLNLEQVTFFISTYIMIEVIANYARNFIINMTFRKQCKKMLPDGLDWLCYLVGRLKESWGFHLLHIFDMITPNQVEIKDVPIQL